MPAHVCVDGLSQGTVPVVDDTVDLRLDEQLSALPGFQLQEEKQRALS